MLLGAVWDPKYWAYHGFVAARSYLSSEHEMVGWKTCFMKAVTHPCSHTAHACREAAFFSSLSIHRCGIVKSLRAL